MNTIIVGGGVAGLISACLLTEKGHTVTLLEHKKQVGQKLLLACSSGMNFSVDLNASEMAKSFAPNESLFENYFNTFGKDAFNEWLQKWGLRLDKGNGKRLFAAGISAKDFLDTVLTYLQSSTTFTLQTNCTIASIQKDADFWKLKTSCGDFTARNIVFACGGASYPSTGSDGSWVELLENLSFDIETFKPSNCAFKVNWSSKMHLDENYQYIKNVSVNGVRGDLVLTPFGIEGSPVYPSSMLYRSEIEKNGSSSATIDLFPDFTIEQIQKKLESSGGKGKTSFSSWLKKRLSLSSIAFSLFMEATKQEDRIDAKSIATKLKKLQLTLTGIAAIEKAISCSGGIRLEELTDNLESEKHKGLYFCGEMLNIDPPTGGYLIQSCFTTASVVARGIKAKLT